jgi:hypothetical protein
MRVRFASTRESGPVLIKESVTSFRGASLANIAASQSIKLAE